MTPNPTPAQTFNEAPASWNVRYLLNGFDCQLTLRGENGKEILEKSAHAMKWLAENGAEPTRVPSSNGGHASEAEKKTPTLPDGTPDPSWCPIHSIAMKRHEKDGQAWYSHKVGEDWCNGGKAKKG